MILNEVVLTRAETTEKIAKNCAIEEQALVQTARVM